MHRILERGASKTDHPDRADSSIRLVPNWERLRLFMELVRIGSFLAAADSKGISTSSLRYQIQELEDEFGLRLITRHVAGIKVTAEGERILVAIEKMENASFDISRARGMSLPEISGEVRLAATEAFGTFWIVPRLVEFQQSYPQLVVDLQCAMRPADVLRLDAEAAIQVTRPQNPDLKIVRLGRIHSVPSAARSYLANYGTPKSRSDLQHHRLALQFAEQIPMQQVYDNLFPDTPQKGFVAFRTNNSSALLWAIIKGAGIGWSPTYMHAMRPNMVMLDLGEDLIFPFDVWLTYHPDAAQTPKVRRLIDWVIDSFDSRKYPWFRDEFIHPRELAAHYKGPPLVNLFEGLSE